MDIELIEKITDGVIIIALILLAFTIRDAYKRTTLPAFHYFYIGVVILIIVFVATSLFEVITDINLDRALQLFKFAVFAFFLFLAYLFSSRFKAGKTKKTVPQRRVS